MQRLRNTELHLHRAPWFSRSLALLTLLPLLTAGCLGSLGKHANALSDATAPVVDRAAAAYRSANTIHDLRVDSDAAVAFDIKDPVYNPRTIQPLLTDKDIAIRLTVLAAFQEYVRSVVAITSGTDSPQLEAAAKSAGANLTALGNTLAPSVETRFGLATNATPISATAQNIISTAANALGQFLVRKKIKKELPSIVITMDPHVKALCDLLQSDIAILTDQETRDYNSLINQQTDFIYNTKNLDPGQRRELIMKLPEIVRQQRLSSEALKQLSDCIERLELTHHAFAADAQGNNPESINQKLSDLSAAGKDLGNFYTSLSTK